tara:strand:+ start:1666 stop:2496 length:831 start_codon:yes stop_codon:yes gene_type:complete
MRKVFKIAEIGINHNGSLEITTDLIDGAVKAKCDIVKFQKRNIDLVYSQEDLDRSRTSPWGTTNRQQKMGLEFEKEQYDFIDQYCKEKGIAWMASAWDIESQKFINQYDLDYNKIASAMLTHKNLLQLVAQQGKYTFISTGMSTLEEIEQAVSIFREHSCPFELMHCNSTYPMKNKDANLSVIETLKNTFSCDVGYSGHETGRVVSLVAVSLGATSVERHITLDKSMYGSDQSSSIEIDELVRLMNDIEEVLCSFGSPVKRVLETELPIRDKLRNF